MTLWSDPMYCDEQELALGEGLQSNWYAAANSIQPAIRQCDVSCEIAHRCSHMLEHCQFVKQQVASHVCIERGCLQTFQAALKLTSSD